MKKQIVITLSMFSVIFLGNWGTPSEPSAEGRKKPNINFHGTLKTRQGKVLKVANITIGRMIRQIPMYEVPTKEEFVDRKTHTIKEDPDKKLEITRIDLVEVSEIRVPHPDTIWIYQKEEKSRKHEYIELTIISNDKNRTKNSYLIPLNKKVHLDGVSKAGAEEKDIPLQAIESIKIKGYTYRDADKPKKAGEPREVVTAKKVEKLKDNNEALRERVQELQQEVKGLKRQKAAPAA